jgi:putative polymerase
MGIPNEHAGSLLSKTISATGVALVITATCFNMILCFISTRHWVSIGAPQVILVEGLIALIALIAIRQRINVALIRVSTLFIVTIGTLALFNTGLDLKILFDIALAPLFFVLGTASSIARTNRMVHVLLLTVVSVGLLEWLFPDTFQDVFDIWGYYTNKGALSDSSVNYSDTRLFISGARDSDIGRTLLPALFGTHRVSSVFLEPVSMGNFPIICLAWFLSQWSSYSQGKAITLAAIASCIIMPDSRFAAASCALMILWRGLPCHRSAWLAALLPVVTAACLVVLGLMTLPTGAGPELRGDDFSGRVLFSGMLLAFWNWPQWLGLVPSPVYTADTGYAYAISNMGLPLTLFVWLSFAAIPLSSPEARSMRGMVAIYVATSLCVGASMFSIKTAALLWFVCGVFYRMDLTGVPSIGANSTEAARIPS